MDDCDHEDVEVVIDPLTEAADPAEVDFGPILQYGYCDSCGAVVERHLRVDGWSTWRTTPATL